MKNVIDRLLSSAEPSTRYKTLVHVLGESHGSSTIRRLQEEIRISPRVKVLLSERGPDCRIPSHPYAKYYGAHWVLVTLADLGYPPGERTLVPLAEQALGWIASPEYETRLMRR
jgi:hypothetical protein